MKKLSGNTITNIVAAILLLASLIIVEVAFNTSQGWFDTNSNPVIIVLAVLGILFLIVSAGLDMRANSADNGIVSLVKIFLSVGACVCAGIIFGLVMGAIATELAYTFFSDFNKGTPKEYFMPTACTQAIVGMVLTIVTIITTAAANAFSEKKG